jgi:membrane-bound serine protease (ClpP class)
MTVIITLIAIALALLFLEIFLPGGLLAVLAVGFLLAASIFTLIDYGVATALAVLVGSSVLACIMFFIEIRVIEKSPFGKHIQLRGRIEGASLSKPDITSLEGKVGRAITRLNPSGRISIDGKSILARADDGWIEKDEAVEVVDSDVFGVRVRAKHPSQESV